MKLDENLHRKDSSVYFLSDSFFPFCQQGSPLTAAVLLDDLFTIISNSPTETCSKSLHFILPDCDLTSNQICPHCILVRSVPYNLPEILKVLSLI